MKVGTKTRQFIAVRDQEYCKEICSHDVYCSLTTLKEVFHLCPCLKCIVRVNCRELCNERDMLYYSNSKKATMEQWMRLEK